MQILCQCFMPNDNQQVTGEESLLGTAFGTAFNGYTESVRGSGLRLGTGIYRLLCSALNPPAQRPYQHFSDTGVVVTQHNASPRANA